MELSDAVVFDARHGFQTEWPYAPTQAVGQLALFVMSKDPDDKGRAAASPAAPSALLVAASFGCAFGSFGCSGTPHERHGQGPDDKGHMAKDPGD